MVAIPPINVVMTGEWCKWPLFYLHYRVSKASNHKTIIPVLNLRVCRYSEQDCKKDARQALRETRKQSLKVGFEFSSEVEVFHTGERV